jgi:hypothetical protein
MVNASGRTLIFGCISWMYRRRITFRKIKVRRKQLE